MSAVVLSVISAGSIGGGWYVIRSYDPASARRRLVANSATKRKEEKWCKRWRSAFITPSQRERLEVTGTSEKTYLQSILMFSFLGAIGAWLGFGHSIFAIAGALGGYGWAWLTVAARYASWQKKVAAGIPDLVRVLKLRMMAGEKPSLAVERVVQLLPEALGVEWRRMLAQLHAGDSFETALDALNARIADRNFTAVITRLRTYHRTGVPDDPFGDMSERLARAEMILHQGRMKRLTAPLTWYALIGFLGVFMITFLPEMIVRILQALQGSPIL